MPHPVPPPRHATSRPSSPQTPTFWIDESGSRASAHRGFVLAGIKTRHPDRLQRDLFAVRERFAYTGEFKFTRVGQMNFPRFAALLDVVAASDAHLVATVVDARWNPFKVGDTHWAAQAGLISRLVIGGVNANELATVLMDGISTPQETNLGQLVKRTVNAHFRSQVVVSAISLDSRANDLLQLADLVAGAIRYDRFEPHSKGPTPEAKRRIVKRVTEAFDVADLTDRRHGRVRIATVEGPGLKPPGKVLSQTQSCNNDRAG